MAEPTICIKCEFYQERQFCRMCIAKVKPVTNFVTGKRELTNYRLCKDTNTCGKCPDYKEMRE